jgi:hypothetical protein
MKKKEAKMYSKGKGKTSPVQARTGLEVSRKMRFPDFMEIGTWRL